MLLPEYKAAKYVRMSTDMQVYSIEFQSEVITIYAAKRGLTVIKSYEDAGRSGVRIDKRAALQELLDDVCSGRADFRTVLVYDVSRWGRFQDCDESAHYEYLCRQAGVGVEYCAEQFSNDGSLTSAVLKNIKRAMAGEYSRELSQKVFAGQRKVVENGFHVGATAGYGLRRILLDEDGRRKMELKFGQRKSLRSERVILVPGPRSEIRTVHLIYDLFVNQKRGLREIAGNLNKRGVPGENGRPWTYLTVREVLSNEKYIGNAVFNRTSQKLRGKARRNPASEWVRCNGAFAPIVSMERFREACNRLTEIRWRPSKNDMLDYLTALWCRHGYLSAALVNESPYGPCDHSYHSKFGSLARAYRMIGYREKDSRGKNADMRKALIEEIKEKIARRGGNVSVSPWNKQLLINDEFTVNVFISRLKTKGPRVWQFGYRSEKKPDIVVGARVAERGGPITEYYLLPFMLMPHGSWVTTSMTSATRLDRFRCKTLDKFYDLCARRALEVPKW
jgi:DNA invertase Pin-like site-specific DNA recombinase